MIMFKFRLANNTSVISKIDSFKKCVELLPKFIVLMVETFAQIFYSRDKHVCKVMSFLYSSS